MRESATVFCISFGPVPHRFDSKSKKPRSEAGLFEDARSLRIFIDLPAFHVNLIS